METHKRMGSPIVNTMKRINDQSSLTFHQISPNETHKLLKIHQNINLPNHDVMFPWLHTYSISKPPNYFDAVSIVRSTQVINANWLQDSGILINSMDPTDFFINWSDQIKFDSLRYNYDPNNQHIKEILRQIFKSELINFQIELNFEIIEKLIDICIKNKILPLLKTDPYAWNKYCSNQILKNRIVSNSKISNLHSDTTTKNFQSQNFRRFDLQPAKMIELSKKIIIYCLNCNNKKSHYTSCKYCSRLGTLISLALRFIKRNYYITENNSINLNNYDINKNFSSENEILILKFDDYKIDIPIELIGTPLATDNDKLKIIPTQLLTNFDTLTFNNWHNNLQFHEKLELNKMSSATPIDIELNKQINRLWCGNITDYQIYNIFKENNQLKKYEEFGKLNSMNKKGSYYLFQHSTILHDRINFDSNNPTQHDSVIYSIPRINGILNLIIRCSEQSTFPTLEQLWSKLDLLINNKNSTYSNTDNGTGKPNISPQQSSVYDEKITTFNFPSSGSIGLGNLNIKSIEIILNTCFMIWLINEFTDLNILLYCTDGYTETSFLLVAYLIFIWDLPLEETLIKLHIELERPFFLFQVDLQVLGHLQFLLRTFSPKRIQNFEKYSNEYKNRFNDIDRIHKNIQHKANGSTKFPDDKFSNLPSTLTIDHEMFSSIFLLKVPELSQLIKLNGPLPSRILPHLYLGSLVHAQNPNLLRKLGITHIVSVGENLSWVSASMSENNNTNSDNKIGNNNNFGNTRNRGISLPPMPNTNRNNIIDTNKNETINPELFNIIEIDGFQCCKINNLEDNGRDPLTGQGQLNFVLNFIDNCEQNGGKVLVHCMVGVSRSATACIAEVMKRLKCDLLRAYLYVRVRRLNIIIQPNLMFMYELMKWQESLVGVPRTMDWHIMSKAIAELNRRYI